MIPIAPGFFAFRSGGSVWPYQGAMVSIKLTTQDDIEADNFNKDGVGDTSMYDNAQPDMYYVFEYVSAGGPDQTRSMGSTEVVATPFDVGSWARINANIAYNGNCSAALAVHFQDSNGNDIAYWLLDKTDSYKLRLRYWTAASGLVTVGTTGSSWPIVYHKFTFDATHIYCTQDTTNIFINSHTVAVDTTQIASIMVTQGSVTYTSPGTGGHAELRFSYWPPA